MRRVRSSAGPDPAVAADENGFGGGGPHEGLGLFVVGVEELFDLAGLPSSTQALVSCCTPPPSPSSAR